MSCKIPPEIQNYIDIVEMEKIPVCKEQKLLATLVRKAFAAEDIYVDINQLAKYMELQRYFPFKLMEWEKFCFTLHNCTYWSDSGNPRFPDLLLMVGRGAGKNGYLSFEDFCLLTAVNNIRGYNIDICATSEDQAKTSFEEVREDVLEVNKPKMSKHFKWTMEQIVNLKTGSKMRFRTNNAKSKDGLRSGKVDFDEYHQYKERAKNKPPPIAIYPKRMSINPLIFLDNLRLGGVSMAVKDCRELWAIFKPVAVKS